MANSNSSNLAPLAIDTSVAINLEASGIALSVFRALSRPVHIVDIVPGELDGGRGHGAKVKDAISVWQTEGLATLVKLSSTGCEHFETLITGAASETLDDGEAATIVGTNSIRDLSALLIEKASEIRPQADAEIAAMEAETK